MRWRRRMVREISLASMAVTFQLVRAFGNMILTLFRPPRDRRP